jgi:O-antigen/teichoic acid export membrane protein
MSNVEGLSSLRSVATGSFWNFVGRGLPLLVALFVTPLLIRQLGVDRWGLFTLALSLGVALSIFDFGISRALTRAVAEKLGQGQDDEVPGLIITAVWVLLGLGLIGWMAGHVLMPMLIDRILRVPPELREEAILAFRVLMTSTPLILLNFALNGVLMAYQKYRASSFLSILVTTAYFVGPVLVLAVWDSLTIVMVAMVGVRLLYTVGASWIALRTVPGLYSRPAFRLDLMPQLLRVGLWVALSGLLTPFLMYADRFMIAALLPLSAVSYYATPFDLVARFAILPVAITTALFPALSACHGTLPERTAALMRQGILAVSLTVFPACLLTVVFSSELLTLWLGSEFSTKSHAILQLLGTGIFFSCISLVLVSLLDAIGRPDLGAKLLIGKIFVFLPLSAALIYQLGTEGAAVAFMLRTCTGAVGRLWLCARFYQLAAGDAQRILIVLTMAGGLLLACAVPVSLPVRCVATVVALLSFSVVATSCLLRWSEAQRLFSITWGFAVRRMMWANVP